MEIPMATGQFPGTRVRFAFLVVSLIATGTLPAQEEHPRSKVKWERDLKEALGHAQKDGKLVLVHFGAEWCTWCRKMDADTFASDEVGALCAKSFVSVAVDVDKDKDLVAKYRIERVPTAAVLLPEGDLVEVLDGYVGAAEFKGWLAHAREDFARYREAQEKARKKPDDPEAACRVVDALMRLNQHARAVAAIEPEIAARFKGAVSSPEERKAKAELLVHLGDAYLQLGESPRKILGVARDLKELDPAGKFGFEVAALFLEAATDDILVHELERDAEDLEGQGKKGPAGKRRSEARKLQASVLDRLELCLEKYPESDRTDAILMWLGHLYLEARGDAARAAKMFQQVVDKYPESVFLDEARQRLKGLSGEKPKSNQKVKKP